MAQRNKHLIIQRKKTLRVSLARVKLNPLRVIGSALILLSPFLTWLTALALIIVRGIVLTGFAAQSNLWDVATYNTGMPISQGVASAAFYAAVVLMLGGVIGLRNAKIGFAIAAIGPVAFTIMSYSIFGRIQNGATTTIVSPGIGFFGALVGVVLGGISTSFKGQPIVSLIGQLKTKEGLTKAGLLLSAVPLVLDGFNHWALGQVSAFLGANTTEQELHIGFLVGFTILFILVNIRRRFNVMSYSSKIVIMMFIFLILDAVYHTFTGGIQNFVGHNSVEIVLHVSTYYGVVLLMISTVFLERK